LNKNASSCIKYQQCNYLSLDTKVNLKHLEARLKQTKTIEEDVNLTKALLIEILDRRFDQIDYERAKSDIKPFIKDQSALDLWNKDFFKSITNQIEVVFGGW